MAITITITDPQDHAPYELRVLAEYFQALANDKQQVPDIYSDLAKELGCTRNEAKARMLASQFELYKCGDKTIVRSGPAAVRTTHDEERLSDEERAALLQAVSEPEQEDPEVKILIARMGEDGVLRGTAGGDQEPYAVNAGGSDDFAELRDDPKPDASTGAAASDGKTAQAASTPSLDSAGMPWDERIHSGSKSVNADGTWRYKRGGDLTERERIEAELKGESVALNYPAADDDIPPPPVEDDVPPPPAEEDDVPPPPAEEEAPQVDSGAVFRAITAGQKANLSQEDIARCLKDVGLTTTVDILTAKPEVLAPLKALIEEASK